MTPAIPGEPSLRCPAKSSAGILRSSSQQPHGLANTGSFDMKTRRVAQVQYLNVEDDSRAYALNHPTGCSVDTCSSTCHVDGTQWVHSARPSQHALHVHNCISRDCSFPISLLLFPECLAQLGHLVGAQCFPV